MDEWLGYFVGRVRFHEIQLVVMFFFLFTIKMFLVFSASLAFKYRLVVDKYNGTARRVTKEKLFLLIYDLIERFIVENKLVNLILVLSVLLFDKFDFVVVIFMFLFSVCITFHLYSRKGSNFRKHVVMTRFQLAKMYSLPKERLDELYEKNVQGKIYVVTICQAFVLCLCSYCQSYVVAFLLFYLGQFVFYSFLPSLQNMILREMLQEEQ